MSNQGSSKFEEQAANAGGGFFSEFWIFLKEKQKVVASPDTARIPSYGSSSLGRRDGGRALYLHSILNSF